MLQQIIEWRKQHIQISTSCLQVNIGTGSPQFPISPWKWYFFYLYLTRSTFLSKVTLVTKIWVSDLLSDEYIILVIPYNFVEILQILYFILLLAQLFPFNQIGGHLSSTQNWCNAKQIEHIALNDVMCKIQDLAILNEKYLICLT